MSELQAILQARRRRLASSPAPQPQDSQHIIQDGGRTSNANVESEVQTTAQAAVPLAKTFARKNDERQPQALSLSPPRSPKRHEQRNWSTTIGGGSESDAIEVSPTGAGREALRLDMASAPTPMPMSSRQQQQQRHQHQQQQQQQNELHQQQSQISKPSKSERSLSPPSELQRKLRERRMKATETLRHVKQSQSQNLGRGQQKQHEQQKDQQKQRQEQEQEQEQAQQKQPEHQLVQKVEQRQRQSQTPSEENFRTLPSTTHINFHRHSPPSSNDAITNPTINPQNAQPPPRKSTFFPRSTPPLRNNSTGSQDSSGSVQTRIGGEAAVIAGGLILGTTMNNNYTVDGIYSKPKQFESISDDEEDGNVNQMECFSVKEDNKIPNIADNDKNANVLNNDGAENNDGTGKKSDENEALQTSTSDQSDSQPRKSPVSPRYDFRRTVAGRAASLQNSPRNQDRGVGDGDNNKHNIGNKSMLSLMTARYKEEQKRQQKLEEEERGLGQEREPETGDESNGDEEDQRKKLELTSTSSSVSKGYSRFSSNTTGYYRPGMTPKKLPVSNQSPQNNFDSMIEKKHDEHLEERKQHREGEGEENEKMLDEADNGNGHENLQSNVSSSSNISKGYPGYLGDKSVNYKPGMKTYQLTPPTDHTSHKKLNKWLDQRNRKSISSISSKSIGTDYTGTGKSNIHPPSPSRLATTATATEEFNKTYTRRSNDAVVAINEEDEASAMTDHSIPEFMRTRLKLTTPKSTKSTISAGAADNDASSSVVSQDGPRKPPKIVRDRWSPSHNTHPVSSPLAAQTGPKSPASNQYNSLQSSDNSNRRNQPPWERYVTKVSTEKDLEEGMEKPKSSRPTSISSKIARFQKTSAKSPSLTSNAPIGRWSRGAQPSPIEADQTSSQNVTTKEAESEQIDTASHDVHSRDQPEKIDLGDDNGENLNDVEEEVLDKNDPDGTRFHDQHGEFHYVSNYDAAVLAAKEAINTSNRTRTHRIQQNRNHFHQVEGDGDSMSEHDENDVGDPQIHLEASPSSSVVVGPWEQDLSNTKAVTSEAVNNEGEISFDEEEARDQFHDLPPISPSSLSDPIDESGVSESQPLSASAVFGSSFLESSDIFGSNSNKNIFLIDKEQFTEDPFFASDPFATFSREQDPLNGQSNFHGNEQREETVNSHFKESLSFEAEFEHSEGYFVDHEKTMSDIKAENLNEISPALDDSHISVQNFSIIDESSSIEGAVDATFVTFPTKNLPGEDETKVAGVGSKNLPDDLFSPQVDSHYSNKDEVYVSADSSHSDEIDLSSDERLPTGSLASFIVSDLKLPSATIRGIGRTTPSPKLNPLTGNIISCWCNDRGDYLIEEFSMSPSRAPAVALSVRVLTQEFEEKVVRSNALSKGSKVIGVKSVLSLAAGVHRVKGLARVRVAAIAEVVVASNVGSILGRKTIKAVAVWKWGYNPGRRELASLQSVLSISDTDEENYREINLDTLQIADGLIFLGGHVVVSGIRDRTLPSIFIAKPAVRDGWVTIHVESTNLLPKLEPPESAHVLRQDQLSVSVLSVTDEANTYIAVGLTDGSISVWTYDVAVRTNRISVATASTGDSKQAIHSPSLLQPLCRVGGEYDVSDLSDVDCLWQRETSYSSFSIHRTRIESFHVSDSDRISLAWVRQSLSGISSLALLAVACSSGVAVYHISLSVQKDLSAPVAGSLSELSSCSDELQHTKMQRSREKKGYPILKETAPTSITSAEIISPLAKASFVTKNSKSEVEPSRALSNVRAKVGWFDLGPRSVPCLSILLEHSNMMRLCLCPIDIPWYGSVEVIGSDAANVYRPIGVLCEYELNPMEGRTELLNLDNLGCIGVSFSGGLVAFKPTLTNLQDKSGLSSSSRNDGYFSRLSLPAASASFGLDNEGCIYHGESRSSIKSSYQDTILSFFSIISCKRRGVCNNGTEKLDGMPSVKPLSLKWSVPSQRHWLLLSSAGDITIEGLQRNQVIDEDELMRDTPQNDTVKAGATTDVLCELTCGENPVSGLVPERIVREFGGRRAAILFSQSYFGCNFRTGSNQSHARSRTHTRIPPYPVAYAIIDIDVAMEKRGSVSFDLRHGRDVAFLPPSQTEGDFYCSSVVVLGPDGSDISVTTIISSRSPHDSDKMTVVESIDKCSLHNERIEGQRVFALLSGDHPELLIAGHSTIVGRSCLILSNHSLKSDADSNFLILVEDNVLGRRLWLRNGEQILSIAELPKRVDNDRANIAVATHERVMIISTNESLTIIAEIDACITSTSLSPIGSHCVAFCASSFTSSDFQIMYLSCLRSEGRHGIISTMPSHHRGKTRPLLLGLRPDRFSCHLIHSDVCLGDDGDDEDKFLVPIPLTYPSFLLEPLVANAICQDGEYGRKAAFDPVVQQCLRTVIEKFGRKELSFPHSDNCGIGSLGTGITIQLFKILERYDCKQAASFLLTGFPPNDTTSKLTILPPWIPMRTKSSAAFNLEILLQVLSCGDNGLAEALRHQDREVQSGVLPKPNDPPCIFAEDIASVFLMNESVQDALKLLRLSGSSSSESAILQLALANYSESCADRNFLSSLANGALNDVAQYSNLPSLSSQVAAVSTARSGSFSSEMSTKMPAARFSPSFNAHSFSGRAQSTPKNVETYLPARASPGAPTENIMDFWTHRQDTSKHIWRIGPFGRMDEILELENFPAWIGRYRPSLLGEEGVAIAADTGERTLADILSKAAQEEVNMNSEEESMSQRNDSIWVEGVGEGRQDEDNLSLYIRFSEGADEDDQWKTDGFTDLTKYGNKAQLFGSELASLEATTSSADEGEEGKVRLLYDLVYIKGAPRDQATGLAVEVLRGSSLDIGMLHASQNKLRQRCTIEFWYRLPEKEYVEDEIILARRSLLYEEQIDESTLCLPDEKLNTLWELVVLPNGLLELRSGAGSVVSSAVSNDGSEDKCHGLVIWGRYDGRGGWNHVCLIFSSIQNPSPTECFASILMNGVTIVDSISFSVNPFGLEADHDINQDEIDEAMQKSIMAFGIGPSVGFRMTDIRVWACHRAEEDVRLMMYEHLRDAEIKKKFKVKIRAGPKPSGATTSGLLAPPMRPSKSELKNTIQLMPSPHSSKSMSRFDAGVDEENCGFAPSFADFNSNEGEKSKSVEICDSSHEHGAPSDLSESDALKPDQIENELPTPDAFGTAEFVDEQTINYSQSKEPNQEHVDDSGNSSHQVGPPVETTQEGNDGDKNTTPLFEVTLSDLISSKVRKSAAAAIVRGPPATRHFGGNRAGLSSSNCSGPNSGVGPIAICGAEKSIVFYSDRELSGKTLPIGASGAVLSDIMGEDQREYMCCFLSKEKRMVVFELSRKTVVVELQMKTKLNFWRYLPPGLYGDDLTFLLITPIGGFHWKPLNESPRPRQVWKRGTELESKKILAYEEGGCNGEKGTDAKSTVALVTASSVATGSPVEAYCISLDGQNTLVPISQNVMGTALYNPPSSVTSLTHFLPLLVTVVDEQSQFILCVESLTDEVEGKSCLGRGSILASVVLDIEDESSIEAFEPPHMSMGSSPEALCCCKNGFIVTVIRRMGLVFIYDFSNGDLSLVGKSRLTQYIVDAAIREGDVHNEADVVELVMLVSENEDPKDGRIANIKIGRTSRLSNQ
ncbi:hypothetical protein ACHAXS_010969 [Conticribra weissflogii]